MPLNKQAVDISFAQGMDQKTDPWRLPLGKFQNLQNSVFQKGGMLTKRNGYGVLASLFSAQSATPSLVSSPSSYLTTLNNNLTAIGPTISAYNAGNKMWVAKGSTTPMGITTLPIIRNNLNQTQCDSALSLNGLLCTAYTELNNSSSIVKYVVSDASTGQNLVQPTQLPTTTSGSSPRVFLLGNYFIIVWTDVNVSTPNLQYIAISIYNTTLVSSPVIIHAGYTSATTVSWDGIVVGQYLYVGANTVSGGQAIKIRSLNANLVLSATVTFSGGTLKGSILSMCADTTNSNNPVIYCSFWSSATNNGYVVAVNNQLQTLMTQTQFATSISLVSMTSAAQSGVLTIYQEVVNNYGYDGSIPSNYIAAITVTKPATVTTGTVGTLYTVIRSMGLASKAFILNRIQYFLSSYQSSFQPTYFLVNGSSSTAAAPLICGKLAYSNGGGYLATGLPTAQVSGTNVTFPYLRKDFIQALSVQGNPQQTTTGGIYSQTGINLATINFDSTGIDTAETANSLHLSGGFLGQYDGYLPVEHNFFLWPDNVEATWSATGGSIVAKPDGSTNTNAYYYQVVYEWSDNSGNIHRSAPSIPVAVTTSGSGTSGSIAVNIPTLRATMKTSNPVKITIYRWSVANQIYYQITSITAPTLNITTSDYVTYTDTLADASIIGNAIIYTNGGVIENANAPGTNILTLFDTRLWLVDAEDQNLLWYSKQIIEATPVEMSDLFTIYVAPNTGTASSTGPITALAPMDDKLIIFKKDAIYYINGTGPDNTGANSQYSQPIFITSTVGCNNQQSVVLTPNGLMFQSDKGIWLLDRGLNSSYIGAPVNSFNSSTVNSAVNVPGTNQIRFTLNTGQTLMYDYYYQQWGTFIGVPATSSCIFQGLHTFINQYGIAYQETPGLYLDGANPVLLSFTTSWLNLAGLQGYERSYYFYLLGRYFTPYKLQMQIAYDYNPSPSQSTMVVPDNFSSSVPSPFGDTPAPFGSSSDVFQARIFLTQQKCESFQITMNEVYDPSFGVTAGQGFSLSGIDLVVGLKKGYMPIKGARSFGGNG